MRLHPRRVPIVTAALDGGGALYVTTATFGAEPDSNGYEIRVSESLSQITQDTRTQPTRANETVRITGLAPGEYRVWLAGVEQNCDVAGNNPRAIDIRAGETATTTFSVSCAARAPRRQ